MRRVATPNTFVVIAALLGAALCCSCGGGGGGGSPAPHVNHAPTVVNDRVRADGAALDAIKVLANDSDPDGDALTVSIEEAPFIGTASVNGDNTVRLANLPANFKGVTRFKYRATDGGGLSAVATAAVFVGTDPITVLLAGDSGNGAPEVYSNDLAAAPQAVTTATQGTLRLRGFIASDDGRTVVYRRADTSNAASVDLSFARGGANTRIVFPGGALPVQDANGGDQFAVSPDGQWIAAVAGSGGTDGMYVLNVATPSTVNWVSPQGAAHAAEPRFSRNSQALYFLATPVPSGGNRTLFTMSPGSPAAPTQVSANVAAFTDDISGYSISGDQTRILMEANRSGSLGLYFVDPTHLQSEVRVSHVLLPGESILDSTTELPVTQGGSVRGDRVAYTTGSLLTFTVYVADVSSNPNPHAIASGGAHVVGFRPDEAAVLYTRGGQIYESPLDGSGDQVVGAGASGWYDSTGNIILLKQFLPSGGNSSYPALAVTMRGGFGTTAPLGTPVLAAHYIDASGVASAVALIGEGATTGPAPAGARLALVNEMAPDKLFYLSDAQSPLNLTSPASQVVAQ